MNGGEIFITISLNCLVIFFLHVLHKRSIARTVQHLRKEVDELENLVAAIIEEFEEVANKVLQAETNDLPVPKIENSIEEPIKSEFLKDDEIDQVVPNELFQEILLEVKQEFVESKQNISEAKKVSPPETIPMFQPQDTTDPKHQQIFQLWKDGLAIEEIAKQLGTGRGEVQLILGIYKRS